MLHPQHEDITKAAQKMLLAGLEGRAARFADIAKSEDMYNGVIPPALKGRNNVPFDSVVMGGFLDTLLAETTSDISIRFNATREQDKLSADKIGAVFDRESAPDRGDWNGAIQDAKFLAGFSGRGFLKPVFSSIPRFSADLFAVDHYDMVVEPMGGRHLDHHEYKFQQNIFRTDLDLKSAAESGFYDMGQVRVLINRYSSEEYRKELANDYGQKLARYSGFGIEARLSNLVGSRLFNMCEGVLRYKGEWIYIFFDPRLGVAVRCEPLTNVLEIAKDFPGRGPWATFATHRHPKLFWSKAPADDVRPIAYAMKKIMNLTLDNLEKRNWDMKAYDPRIFREPTKLLYRQDGLVRATLKGAQKIEDGIFHFQTPDTSGITVNLSEWLQNFVGKHTGITAAAQGAAKEDKVGILVSNLQQTSKRLSLENKTFKEAMSVAGTLFDYGIYEHLREPYAVKLIGIKGARWEEEVDRRDTDKNFTISVSDSETDDQKTALEVERKNAGFGLIDKAGLSAKINPNWRLREYLKMMGYDDEQVRIALDTQNDADQEVLAKAAQAIQDCLEGKDLYEVHMDATSGFVQKILDFCTDNYPLLPPEQLAKMGVSQRKKYHETMKEHDKLIKYAQLHVPIAQKNAVRFAVSTLAGRAIPKVSIAYKDLPPDVQRQAEESAGYKPHQEASPVAGPGGGAPGGGSLPVMG